jgi:hypothetical protein
MTRSVGLIVEDESDFDVLKEVIPKINSRINSLKKVVAHGSGRIIGKANSWSNNLRDKGCTCLIVVRDCDNESLSALRERLDIAYRGAPFTKKVLVVAVQEIESWLLADLRAVHKVFGRGGVIPKSIPSPENVQNPKEHLKNIIHRKYAFTYLNTVDNRKIAKELDVSILKSKCPSFEILYDFIESI